MKMQILETEQIFTWKRALEKHRNKIESKILINIQIYSIYR